MILFTIIDSIMGSGKTTFMIKHINRTNMEHKNSSSLNGAYDPPRFIYIAPLLTEVDRIVEACPDLDFCDPQPVHGRKLYHLDALLDEGKNVCTTHSLFRSLTRPLCEKIKAKGYTLVIDETLECVSVFDDLTKSDRDLLLDKKVIYLDDKNKLRWNHADQGKYKGKFNHIRSLCDNGNLVLYRDTVMLWEFPTEFMRSFSDVFVLTYLFEGSPMSSYLRAEGIEYEVKTLRDGYAVEIDDKGNDLATRERLRALVNVYEGPLNECGKRRNHSNPLSVSWLRKQKPETLRAIKATTEYYFKAMAKTLAIDNAWTTFSDARTSLAGSGYTKGFIPCNAKATNDYKDKKSLAYLCNVFYNPYIRGYFEERGVEVNEDANALSEMIQWIWRSQIRDGKPIMVFIPSERMRGLFLEWLSGEDSRSVNDQDIADIKSNNQNVSPEDELLVECLLSKASAESHQNHVSH